ncbi:MAG: hypothetical protein IJG13_01740 [Kiritimatiellae bacterium]|nr:hypothetical protein [Kiritimatiellia bacterium]
MKRTIVVISVAPVFHVMASAAVAMAAALSVSAQVKDLGSVREVMWDMDRIASLGGGAALKLHHPQLREIALVHDAPWEGNVCCYHTVLRDDTNYKMYYRGSAWKLPGYRDHQVVCYAESDDGIVWRKPTLGLHEYDGSKENNIIMKDDGADAAHNFSPFYDRNPACKPDEKYKAVAGGRGMYGFASSDGIRWRKVSDKPLVTNGDFDSQNIVFWDVANDCYVAYYRKYWKGPDGRPLRGIQRVTSPDFLHWSNDPKWVSYDTEAPNDQLYTNAIHPYDRAPGIYVGFPKRFTEGRNSAYDKSNGGGIPGVSDGVFMSSRDGMRFFRWAEAFLRPGLQHERWINRNNMIAWGFVQTKSAIAGCPDEISLYSTENYYSLEAPNRLRRMTIRLDGFVSVNAPWHGGAVTTKPLTFSAAQGGKVARLLLNASTSGAGFIRCEIRDENGKPYPGYSLEESVEVFGDGIELPMAWKSGADVTPLAGKTVVLRFDMKDADVYSYRFR